MIIYCVSTGGWSDSTREPVSSTSLFPWTKLVCVPCDTVLHLLNHKWDRFGFLCMWALSSSTVLCLKIFRLLVFYPQVVLLSCFWWGLIRASVVRWRECMSTMNMTFKYAIGKFRLWWDIPLYTVLYFFCQLVKHDTKNGVLDLQGIHKLIQ